MENDEIIKNAVKYIDRFYWKSGLNIDEIAANAGFSVDYFNRIFRAHTGFNIMAYVRFRNLNKASEQLRHSDKSILQIALDSGYESHDGFTRAFKTQYGKTPDEYRNEMKNSPVIFADYALNATAASQIKAALPDFFEMNSDDVIDTLLNQNTERFGYDAITIRWNGSAVLADSKLVKSGGYVACDMFFDEGPYLNLKLHDVSMLREYVDKLAAIEPWTVSVCFDEDTDEDAVRSAIDGISFAGMKTQRAAMYFGEAKRLPDEADRYTISTLEPSDLDAVAEWSSKALKNGDWGLRRSICADRSIHPDDIPFGMFSDDGTLIGVARLSFQEAHEFRINNCISTVLLPEYREGPENKWLYLAALNEVLKTDFIPYEEEYAEGHGIFSMTDIGYDIVNTHYIIEF